MYRMSSFSLLFFTIILIHFHNNQQICVADDNQQSGNNENVGKRFVFETPEQKREWEDGLVSDLTAFFQRKSLKKKKEIEDSRCKVEATPDTRRNTVAWKDTFDDALANNLESLKCHIEEGHFPLNQTNSDQETLAHIATKQKNIVMLKYLLGKDSSLLNVLDKWDQTVLTVAIDKGAIDIVRYLVDDLKADIYYPHRQRFGNMAIHIAAEEGQLEVLKYLVEEKKVDVNILNYLREPPVFVAAEKSRFPVVKYLVEDTKTNVTALDSNKDNILFVLAVDGNLELTKYLLDERKIFFDVNWQDVFGRTVIYVASRFNHLDFIKYFVEEKGANIHLANNMGWTPMLEASYVGNLDVIKYFLAKGANMNHKDRANQTAIDVAFNFPHVRDFLNKTRLERTRRSVPY